MTEISRPWPGVTVGDAGPYNVNDWYDVWGNLIQGGNAIGNAADYDLGVFLRVGNQLAPVAASAAVTVDTGASLVDGLFHYNDASVSVAIPAAAAGLSRIDYIVVRKNYQLAVTYTPTGAGPIVPPRTARITVIRGTEAASPVAPGDTQLTDRSTYWDIPIATVQVNDGGVLSALTDLREYIPVWDTDNIADEAITTAKIDDGAVTTIKIADDAVTEIKHNQADTEYGDYHPLLRQANDAIQADSGGNARGLEAIDLQQSRSAVTMVGSGNYSSVGGGEDNTADGVHATVIGGFNNTASGIYAVAGGRNSQATADTTIAIGALATATVEGAMAFGISNAASGQNAFAAGLLTAASGAQSVALGDNTTASGDKSVSLGSETIAAGDYSVAAGRRALTGANDGVFIFADSEAVNFTADRADQFKVRAKGGVHFVQNGAASAIPVLELEQDDPDEPFIEFDGTSAADASANISTMNGGAGAVDGPLSGAGGWTFNSMVKINQNGTDVWIASYTPVV